MQVQPLSDSSKSGLRGNTGLCAKISNNVGLAEEGRGRVNGGMTVAWRASPLCNHHPPPLPPRPAALPQGALALKTHPGAFVGKYKLNFWLYVGVTGWEGTAAQVPDITINLSGSKVRSGAGPWPAAWPCTALE